MMCSHYNVFARSVSLSICSLFLSAQAFAMGSKLPANPPDSSSNDPVADITAIAQASSCAAYSWKDRGRAPAAYIAGMSVTFAKALCRLKSGESPAALTAHKNTQNTSTDAIAWYEDRMDSLGLSIDSSGPDTLRSLYTLGVGLGMRESSGKYCEGYDVGAGPETATEAEVGTFQTSYNAISASPELKKLYNSYLANPGKCYLNVFSKNVSCTARGIVGSGVGADFQRFVKSCPAFGAEFAMLTLRVIRKHYGPINRREAEVNSSCNKMLDQVQEYVDSRASSVCSKL